MKNDDSIELLINGEKIHLNNYVHSVFSEVVTALVSTLKLDQEPKKIELTIDKSRK